MCKHISLSRKGHEKNKYFCVHCGDLFEIAYTEKEVKQIEIDLHTGEQ